VWPPGHHRQKFELWHRLDLAGKTQRHGVPKDPLALGMLWELQDGYLAGVPVSIQKAFFGGLARLARMACTKRSGKPKLKNSGGQVRPVSDASSPQWPT
jgi:hypothetical protein